MLDGTPTTLEKDRRVNEALVEYLEAEEAGQAPDHAALLARYPDLATELQEFLDNRAQLAPLADAHRTFGLPKLAQAAEAPPPLPGANRVGDYELLHEIARGGMGVVYRARQVSVNREVALKMLLPADAAPASALRRFRIEAEAAANLDHPNIVPIYDVGEMDGHPYFTMKLIEGGSLLARRAEFALRESAGAPGPHWPAAELHARQRRIAALMAAVARAVHHAHQHGILHRDLKPANILLASDVPMVADFGLAKRTNFDSGVTHSRTIIGTANYMAPEQARPGKTVLTTAADVYSLGSIVYELLTGRPPFLGPTYFATLLRVVHDTPAPPRQLSPQAAPELEMICLKCLKKEPERRYGSALELAEDLERWQAGEAISLRPLGTVERARRWARRNRLAALLALSAVVITLGSIGAAWHIAIARDAADRSAAAERVSAGIAATKAADATEARDAAVHARNLAQGALADREKALGENRRLLAAGYVGNGTRALDTGDLFGALVWYGEALRLDAGEAGLEDAHRVRLAGVLRRCPRLVQVWFDSELPPAFSPDGRRVAWLHKDVARIWRVDTGAAASPRLKHEDEVRYATFNVDGSRLLTIAGSEALVWELSTESAPIPRVLKHGSTVTFAAFSPDGTRIVTAGVDHAAHVWRTLDGTMVGRRSLQAEHAARSRQLQPRR